MKELLATQIHFNWLFVKIRGSKVRKTDWQINGILRVKIEKIDPNSKMALPMLEMELNLSWTNSDL